MTIYIFPPKGKQLAKGQGAQKGERETRKQNPFTYNLRSPLQQILETVSLWVRWVVGGAANRSPFISGLG